MGSLRVEKGRKGEEKGEKGRKREKKGGKGRNKEKEEGGMLTSPYTLPQGAWLWHVPIISLAQRPAWRSHFPVDTELLSPPFPTPHAPAPKHQRDPTAAVPSPLHPDGNSPVTQKSPSASAAPSAGTHPAIAALFLGSPHLLSRWFSRIPFVLLCGISTQSWRLPQGSPQYPQFAGLGAPTSTQNTFTPHPWYELSTPGGTFLGQNQESSFAAHHTHP